MKNIWNSISLIGHKKLKDPNDLRQLTLLNRIASIAIVNLFAFIPLALYFRLPPVAGYVSCGILLCFLTIALNSWGFFKFARIYFLVIALIFITTILTFMSGKDAGSQVVFILIAVLHLVLFKNQNWSFIVFFCIIIVLGLSSYWVETHSTMLDYLSYDLKRFSFYLNIVSTMVLVFAVVLYFKNTAFEFETTITEQNKKITQKNKDITDSINYAKRLQEAILPSARLVKEYLPDSFILYKPKDIVAGDFYWMEQVEDTIIFAAADCTGHGVPGAIVSVVCNNALNRSLREFELSIPGQLLDKTCELVIGQFEKSDAEVKDGMDISLCALNKKTNLLNWAGANNPLWIIRNKELIEIKADKQPIGKYTETKPFTTHTIQLQKDDSIYIFTDGYADQFGGELGKKFKTPALKKILLSVQDKAMAEQREIINRTFENWKGKGEQVDDVCVVGVKI